METMAISSVHLPSSPCSRGQERSEFEPISTSQAMREACERENGPVKQRIQKLLAAAGVASRRKSDELVAAGRVKINGETALTGQSADPAVDEISLDGELLSVEKKRYLLLNKPTGFVTTLSDPEGRPTVMDLVDVEERVYPVGRLDAETSGLLLLTNDGLFSHRVAHPRFEIDKVYVADVAKSLTAAGKQQLETGVELEDGMTRPAAVELIGPMAGNSGKRVQITVHEGKKRIVRRMLDAVGSPVISLERVQLGDLTLDGVKQGKWRQLAGAEVDGMLQAAAKTNKRKKQAAGIRRR